VRGGLQEVKLDDVGSQREQIGIDDANSFSSGSDVFAQVELRDTFDGWCAPTPETPDASPSRQSRSLF
jgi:hypothetical protein